MTGKLNRYTEQKEIIELVGRVWVEDSTLHLGAFLSRFWSCWKCPSEDRFHVSDTVLKFSLGKTAKGTRGIRNMKLGISEQECLENLWHIWRGAPELRFLQLCHILANQKGKSLAEYDFLDATPLTKEYVNPIKKEEKPMSYRDFVKSRIKDKQEILQSITARKMGLIHMAMGLAGEAGEVLEVIKKHTMYNNPLDLEKAIKELGDVMFYLEGLMGELGVNADIVRNANIEKLTKRYPTNYSDSLAKERLDGEK